MIRQLSGIRKWKYIAHWNGIDLDEAPAVGTGSAEKLNGAAEAGYMTHCQEGKDSQTQQMAHN